MIDEPEVPLAPPSIPGCDPQLLVRYLDAVASPEEQSRVRTWLAASQLNVAEFARWRTIWSRTPRALSTDPASTFDSSAAAKRIWASWPQVPTVDRTASAPGLRSHVLKRIGLGVASVALAAIGATGLWLLLASVHVQPFREFTSAAGSRVAVTLRDGSRLTLGPETRLRVATDFGLSKHGARVVELDGEAAFSVVHDARHPFVVHVAGATVQDIGTEFDVRAYRGDGAVRVGVLTGAASVRPVPASFPLSSDGLVLNGGDAAVIDDGHATLVHHADVAGMMAWLQGRLVFTDTPLRDVVHTLEHRFGLTIVITDSSLAKQHVTGSYTDQPVDVILDDITAVVGGQYRQQKKTVTIAPKGAQWRPVDTVHDFSHTVTSTLSGSSPDGAHDQRQIIPYPHSTL